MSYQTFVQSSISTLLSAVLSRNKHVYNTAYMYYIKLLNENVAKVISLIKKMLNICPCDYICLYFTLIFNHILICFMTNFQRELSIIICK